MKSHKALIPLMKMFNEKRNEGTKLVAAWSLLKIGNSKGINLVQNYMDSEECSKIRCILQFLYIDEKFESFLAVN